LADKKPDKLFTDGEAYERLMGRWSRLVAEAFLDWLDVPNDLTWLDVGCGNGAFTEELIGYMWDVPGGGIPVHPIYVTLESMGFMSAGPPNSAASEREAMQRFWKDALVIGFLPDPGAAVAEMARVVRPGGLVTGSQRHCSPAPTR